MTTRLNCKQSWRSQVSEPSKRERLSSWLIQILLEQSHPSSFIFPAFFVARETWKPNDSVWNKTCFCSCAEEDRWNKFRERSHTNWKIECLGHFEEGSWWGEVTKGTKTGHWLPLNLNIGSHSTWTAELLSCSNHYDPDCPSHICTQARSCSSVAAHFINLFTQKFHLPWG